MLVLKERKMVSKLSSINFFANFEKFSNIRLMFSSLSLEEVLLAGQVNATRQNSNYGSDRYYLLTEIQKGALLKNWIFILIEKFTVSFINGAINFSYYNEC